MLRKITALLLIVCLLLGTAAAEGVRRVYRVGEAGDFPEEDALFELFVCPLLGADCMVLRCGGETMLVDMGKANDYPLIREVLTDLGVEKIDIAFNTHPHDDHLGSMTQIAADYPVGQFMTAFPEDFTGPDAIQKSTVRTLHDLKIPVISVGNGTQFSLGGAQLTVVCRPRVFNASSMPNPMSAMLRVTFGECALLLCADVTGSTQQLLAETNEISADIFKFPHHGLNFVLREFLEAIDPEFAFFTHGSANTLEAQAQLDKYGIPYDFATWGVIHLATNGEYWLVDQQLNETGVRLTEKYRGQ